MRKIRQLFLIFGYIMTLSAYEKIDLNGTWQCEPGQTIPSQWNHSIQVPGLVDLAEPAFAWEKSDYVWYRTTFQLPDKGSFSHVILQLEQVKYGTRVICNGKEMGGDTPCYTRQEFDLTPAVTRRAENELLIRVGKKETLPDPNASGKDFEKLSFIPGIWGDVYLELVGPARAMWTRIIPDIEKGAVALHTESESVSGRPVHAQLHYRVFEKKKARQVAEQIIDVVIPKDGVHKADTVIKWDNPTLWSPENPFLYALEVSVLVNGVESHRARLAFGMRQFEIRGRHFFLNGKRRVLFGSNIAFHRLLSDSTRGDLVWNEAWIRKALGEIPKAHNMTFFRFHLGHAYNKWYDIADEMGIMLQDEWMFWTRTGTNRQVEREFTAWIKENAHHPSLVIWDGLNESEDEWLTNELIPRMKALDPTRPWEMVDFGEDHPYIYSLGPVLNDRKFGYTRSLDDLKNSATPVMVNEYLWWWLDRENNPSTLTELVVQRWLGREYTQEDLRNHQCFLASELTELFRRLDLDAIMPFVYLSVGEGPTANWFDGPLADLKTKPVMQALKDAFSPVGVSLELWDRHFTPGEVRTVPVWLFNDTDDSQLVMVNVQFSEEHSDGFSSEYTLEPGERRQEPIQITFPDCPGFTTLTAALTESDGTHVAKSRKPAHVLPEVAPVKNGPAVYCLDETRELSDALRKNHIPVQSGMNGADVVLIGGDPGELEDREALASFVKGGGVLILQEPEFGIETEHRIRLFHDLEISIQKRDDPDRGGYDSYVFPDDPNHFLWKGIDPGHLKMFNGGFGGEMVSRHSVRSSRPFHAAASCNLSLKVPAVLEIPYGKGWVVVSRIQVRGRLDRTRRQGAIYDRRYDPVAERYLVNLVTGYVNAASYHKRIQDKLARQGVYLAEIKASTGQIFDAVDGKMETRWSSQAADPQWVWIDFGRPTTLSQMNFIWETAYGKVYEVYASPDNENWTRIFRETESDGGTDTIPLEGFNHRYMRIDFLKRGTCWGYSLWELEFKP